MKRCKMFICDQMSIADLDEGYESDVCCQAATVWIDKNVLREMDRKNPNIAYTTRGRNNANQRYSYQVKVNLGNLLTIHVEPRAMLGF